MRDSTRQKVEEGEMERRLAEKVRAAAVRLLVPLPGPQQHVSDPFTSWNFHRFTPLPFCPSRAVLLQYKPKRAPARSSHHRPLTQAELLAEAARTEIENTKSLEVR